MRLARTFNMAKLHIINDDGSSLCGLPPTISIYNYETKRFITYHTDDVPKDRICEKCLAAKEKLEKENEHKVN